MTDFLTGLVSTDGFVLGTLVPFLFVLLVVVFIHELGHYLVGRWCGIGAKVFSVGFGPEILGFTDRRGTRWRLSAIPLGGYVKFVGDMNVASAPDPEADAALTPAERDVAFHRKSVARRAATVFAGPAANFLLAVVLFATIFAVFGRGVADPVVSEVRAGGVAEEAGLRPGDVFVSVDGRPVAQFSDIQRYVAVRAGQPIELVMRRGDALVDFTLVPERLEIEDRFGNKIEQGVIGVVNNRDSGGHRVQKYGIVESVGMAVAETWYIVERTGGYIGGVITGRENADQIGGPIRVAQVSGQVATLGFVALLNLAAILSVSIGLLNLLPVPVLDGGHLLFYLFEALRGRPMSEQAQEVGYRIGMMLILGLMVFATWNDITMLFDRS
ncbi:RIP metalloprotease RseP [Oricola cellulosilytica]|uniref:Zinc metalloprotease n=1 Tax=Oricola cellulosilytica TaxID=1429082 RepID=A0A4R0P858_9HYPH|nr:RIP metalloprotease RseP [Oricola cellulosilytica]TCD13210.1 RIP metalloprotease RseP [Oricola cellulosilytica]